METWRSNETGLPIKLRMQKPFDAHVHLRRKATLKIVLPMTAKRFCGAVVMPNTVPPITSSYLVSDYEDEIRDALPEGSNFKPYMTMYLTDTLDPKDVESLMIEQKICGVKYYPRGLTTNSDSSVKDASALWTPGSIPFAVLRILAETRGVLFLHAADGVDTAGNELDPYDQEKHFIEHTLPRIREAHPALMISVEHLSTLQGVGFMREHGGTRLGCSLTAQHLLLDRRDVMRGGFNPHRFWWPIIQPREHKEALREFAKEGFSFVWLGTDSAPHPLDKKENGCCSGGVLTAHAGIELYAEAFEDMGALSVFEAFASHNFLRFIGRLESSEMITMERQTWRPRRLFIAEDPVPAANQVVPFRMGEDIRWKLVDE